MSQQGGFVDPSWPDPHSSGDARIIIYGYVPSVTLCILALVLFALALIVHVFRLVKTRAWYLSPIPVACIMEIVGYSFRYQSAHIDPYRVNFFVLAYFFIVVAPVFMSAAIYTCLSKLISWASANGVRCHSWLHPKITLWGFILCDLIATVVQITGAALIGHAESKYEDPTTANNILLGGLAFQSAAFVTYLALLGLFTYSIRSSMTMSGGFTTKWAFIVTLWAASVLVLLRTLFRLAETSEGVSGFAMVHEVFFGTLDFAPIIVAVFLLAIWYPGTHLKILKPVHTTSKNLGDV